MYFEYSQFLKLSYKKKRKEKQIKKTYIDEKYDCLNGFVNFVQYE